MIYFYMKSTINCSSSMKQELRCFNTLGNNMWTSGLYQQMNILTDLDIIDLHQFPLSLPIDLKCKLIHILIHMHQFQPRNILHI